MSNTIILVKRNLLYWPPGEYILRIFVVLLITNYLCFSPFVFMNKTFSWLIYSKLVLERSAMLVVEYYEHCTYAIIMHPTKLVLLHFILKHLHKNNKYRIFHSLIYFRVICFLLFFESLFLSPFPLSFTLLFSLLWVCICMNRTY